MPRQIRSTPNRVFFPLHVWGPLTEAEARLLGSIAAHAPFLGDEWRNRAAVSEGKAIRAMIIRDLCLSTTVARFLRGARIEIQDAEITEPLDLSFARIPFPLAFVRCRASAPILLHHAHLSHLAFKECTLSGVQANGLIVDGDVVFSGRIRARRGISLERAQIEGDLSLSGAWIKNVDGPALNCESATVGGALYLNERFSCVGEVNLYNARVRGDITFDSARITHRGGFAIRGELVKSDGGIFIREARIRGEIRMRGAECRSNLELDGTSIRREPGKAPDSDPDNDPGKDSGNVLSLDQARIRGSLYLRQGFHAVGDIDLLGSTIGVDLDFDAATIEGSGDGTNALVASRVRVKGNVYLDNVNVTGTVLLAGAHVGGHVRCMNADFQVVEQTPAGEPRGVPSLYAIAITVHGSVAIRGGSTNALFDFRNARIGRNLDVRELKLRRFRVTGLLLENARVGGEFCWVRTRCQGGTKMVLSHARIGRLRHGRESWPINDLYLHGCVYSTIDFSEPNAAAATDRSDAGRALDGVSGSWKTGVARFFSIGQESSDPIRWLKQQEPARFDPDVPKSPTFGANLHRPTEFDPQPYEQLSAVLRRSGHDDEAKQVAIAMEKARCAQTPDPVAKALSRAQGLFVEHGHSTRRLWVLSFLWVMLAAVFFGQAKHARVITTANEEVFLDSAYQAGKAEPEEYPRFNAFVYSLDAFLPIIELRQEAYWMPNAKRACEIRGTDVEVPGCGGLFLAYLWLHIILGWLATTLMVFSVTGLIRQHNSAS